MSVPDEDLRQLFKEGRAADHDAAPSFETTMAAAKRPRQGGGAFAAVALAAAIALAAFWMWPGGEQPKSPQGPELAETNPLPDLPDEEDDALIDDELEALAAWEPAGAAPTDFLLEEQGMLGEVLVPSELDELVLESEDLLMEL